MKITIRDKKKDAVKKDEVVESYPMETDFALRLSNTSFLKFENKSKGQKTTISSDMSSQIGLKPGSYGFEKIAEDNTGPNFFLTCEKKTRGKTDKSIYTKTIKKVSGTISADLKTIKTLTIEHSYTERHARAWETDKNLNSKTVYTDVKGYSKMVFEDLPLSGAIDAFKYRRGKNLPMRFQVKIRKNKLKIKKHLKSYAAHSETVQKGEVIGSRTFSHFDWDSISDNLSLEINIGKD